MADPMERPEESAANTPPPTSVRPQRRGGPLRSLVKVVLALVIVAVVIVAWLIVDGVHALNGVAASAHQAAHTVAGAETQLSVFGRAAQSLKLDLAAGLRGLAAYILRLAQSLGGPS